MSQLYVDRHWNHVTCFLKKGDSCLQLNVHGKHHAQALASGRSIMYRLHQSQKHITQAEDSGKQASLNISQS